MSPEKLVHKANQIGKYFVTQPREDAVAAIADHLKKFWEPRMRAEILAYVAGGGAGLDPPVLKAVESLQTRGTEASPPPSLPHQEGGT